MLHTYINLRCSSRISANDDVVVQAVMAVVVMSLIAMAITFDVRLTRKVPKGELG